MAGLVESIRLKLNSASEELQRFEAVVENGDGWVKGTGTQDRITDAIRDIGDALKLVEQLRTAALISIASPEVERLQVELKTAQEALAHEKLLGEQLARALAAAPLVHGLNAGVERIAEALEGIREELGPEEGNFAVHLLNAIRGST